MGFYTQGIIFQTAFALFMAYGFYTEQPFVIGASLSPFLIVLGAMIHYRY